MDKKDIVLNKKKNNLVNGVIISVLLIIIGFLLMPNKKETKVANEPVKTELSSKTKNTRYNIVNDNNGEIILPVSSFDDDVQYFEYKSIKFFILKSNDGTIRAAFDACDVCFGSKRGYNQVEDYMQCNNCGQVFPEDKINVVLGGCNPSPLTREIIGDNLVIKVDEILKGQRFF